MKKIMFTLLVILLGCGLAFGEPKTIPAPFEKAKELALKTTPNESGNYFLEFEGTVNGENYYFLLAFVPQWGDQKGVIGISGSGCIFEYTESTQKFTIYIFRRGQTFAADEKIVINGAFETFRKLVSLGLL